MPPISACDYREEVEKRIGQNSQERHALWEQVQESLESYWGQLQDLPLTPPLKPELLRQELSRFDFQSPSSPKQAIDYVVQNLRQLQTHFSHPGYFGLYVPQPTSMSVFAEALATGFNSQLATWHSSPFAVELEQHLIREFGALFGYSREQVAGTFTSGGAEANHTAMLTALQQKFPEISRVGLRGLKAQPTLYISAEAHHSLHKAAQACGLGLDSLREVPVGAQLEMDLVVLEKMIAEDRRQGFLPFMVIGTVGTPSSGAVDPVEGLSQIAERENLWLHLDACYGGAFVLLPELSVAFMGMEKADSVAFDPHKALAVSVGTGLYLCRHPGLLAKTFHTDTAYATKASDHLDVVQPFKSSLQWSRRFIGLKLFLSLAVEGWSGYRTSLRHQLKLAQKLRELLIQSNWQIESEGPLPVLCFSDPDSPQVTASETLNLIAQRLIDSGRFWLSTTRLRGKQTVLRACVVNPHSEASHIEALVQALNQIRSESREQAQIP